ncbi:hypothetical protein BX600DRAFT_470925 [Xylariales sp. PMI_506]|nr:hypothetical protein BX600DRAFT_470925 [Xylariales sp. PMI_506]
MSLAQEWESFKTPPAKDVQPAPKPGEKAPAHPSMPLPRDKPTILVFLRHCGCPFAEKAFQALTQVSNRYKGEVHCIAVSHSSAEATEHWVVEVGGNWEVQVVIDQERELYAQWGLGTSSTWHMLGSLRQVYLLGTKEHIWNRPTESGNRWQISGAFAVDTAGVVRSSQVATSASDQPNLDDALTSLGIQLKRR